MNTRHPIELSDKQRERLAELATEQGVSPSELLDQMLLPYNNGHSSNDSGDDLLDTDYHAYAKSQCDPSVNRSQVRQALSGIATSLADAVIAERDER